MKFVCGFFVAFAAEHLAIVGELNKLLVMKYELIDS